MAAPLFLPLWDRRAGRPATSQGSERVLVHYLGIKDSEEGILVIVVISLKPESSRVGDFQIESFNWSVKIKMRSWGLVTVTAGAIAGLFLAAVPAAAADQANAGSIKVKSHADALYPPENDPHVSGCPASFDVYAYGFSNQNVSWTIDQQAPTGTAQVAAGDTVLTPTSPAPPEGARYQGYLVYGMSLPSGHYKIVAHEVGTNATGKQKVFWIASDCPSPTPTPAVAPTPTTTVSPSPSPGVVPTGTPTPTGGVGAGSTPTPTPAGAVSGSEAGSVNGSGGQGGVLADTATAGAIGLAGATGAVLADTGLPIAGGALGGLILLIGAGMLVVRRRLNLS